MTHFAGGAAVFSQMPHCLVGQPQFRSALAMWFKHSAAKRRTPAVVLPCSGFSGDANVWVFSEAAWPTLRGPRMLSLLMCVGVRPHRVAWCGPNNGLCRHGSVSGLPVGPRQCAFAHLHVEST